MPSRGRAPRGRARRERGPRLEAKARALPRTLDGHLEAAVYASCEDGSRQRITIEGAHTEVKRGKLRIRLSGQNDLTVVVRGKLAADDATGRIRAELSPSGTSCEADTRWQAPA